MTSNLITRSFAVLLVLCVLLVGGIASAQSINHDSQHSHHQKAAHGTVLCSWMCAAGQVLDTAVAPYPVERSPVARAEQDTTRPTPSVLSTIVTSRGPPSYAKS